MVVVTASEFRARRNALGLTQTALCKRLDMSERQIRNFETGDWPIPAVVALAVERLLDIHQEENNGGNESAALPPA